MVVVLLSVTPSARGWECPGGPRTRRAEGQLKRGAIAMSSSADTINVDALWPSLAGKQTCANEAAGTVSCVARIANLAL